jgi:hypothetical protein
MSDDFEPRFWRRVDRTSPDGCWNWTGALNAAGYGAVGCNNKVLRTHRVAYELLVGPIPEGLQLDHLCRNRACCNPAHLEPVTNRENWMRGQHRVAKFQRGECQRGHDQATHTYTRPSGVSYCRQCVVDRNRETRQAKAGGC